MQGGKRLSHLAHASVDEQREHAPLVGLLDNVEAGRQGCAFGQNHLHLCDALQRLGQVDLLAHCAFGHNPQVVANALELAQVVAGNEHRKAAFRDLFEHQAPHAPSGEGVDTVHRLVEQQDVRANGERKPDGCLRAHAAAELAERLRVVDLEALLQLEVACEVKGGEHRTVEARHAVRTLGTNEVGLAGNTGDASLDA